MQELLARFSHVQDWIFDLDNTLYGEDDGIWHQISERMTDFVSRHYGIEPEAALKRQKELYKRYGTTLNGLMLEEGVDPHAFMDYVHAIDHTPLLPHPVLERALAALPGRRFVLTNGSRRHAEAILARLEITHLFDGVFDLADSGFVPKPRLEAYGAFLARHDVDPRRAAMFEDMAENLKAPHTLGMTTVLVRGNRDPRTRREPWEYESSDAGYIHFITHDLPQFLSTLPLTDVTIPSKTGAVS
jgi:putative hydrolase of the HAD superfamily